MMQSLILAMYPILKGEFALSFTQIGLITLPCQLTASLLQPLIGLFTDRRPQQRADRRTRVATHLEHRLRKPLRRPDRRSHRPSR